jgi:hypothetical protein
MEFEWSAEREHAMEAILNVAANDNEVQKGLFGHEGEGRL